MRLIALSCAYIVAGLLSGCGPTTRQEAERSLQVAMEAAKRGDDQSAMRHLDESIAAHPLPAAHALRAAIYTAHNNLTAAESELAKGLALDPEHPKLKMVREELDAIYAEQKAAQDRAAQLERQYMQHKADEQARRQQEQAAAANRRKEAIETALRNVIGRSTFWSAKTASEREAYIKSVLAKGDDAIALETSIREAHEDAAERNARTVDPELRKMLTDPDKVESEIRDALKRGSM